jgi:DNA-directed RNA polymerase specialized sigma24 family protein
MTQQQNRQSKTMAPDKNQLQGSRGVFPTTTWTLIRQVQALPTSRRAEALGELLRRYWKPMYAYFRSQGNSQHHAEELVQGFLCQFVEKQRILLVEPGAGRFRDWLLVCMRNFMRSRARHDKAAKRRPPGGLLALETLKATDGRPYEPPDHEEPEAAYLDAWRRDLLARAFQSVAAECERKGRQTDYQVFVDYYSLSDEREVTWKQVAERYDLPSWKDAARKADWVRARLGQAIRSEVALYVESVDQIDDEIRSLFQ